MHSYLLSSEYNWISVTSCSSNTKGAMKIQHTHRVTTINCETVFLFDARVVLGVVNVTKLPYYESEVGVS